MTFSDEENDMTYKKFVSQNLCRLCWIPVTGDVVCLKTEPNNDIFDKVLDCLGINLYEKIIPNKICDECIAKIESFSHFKTSCICANEKLQTLLETCKRNILELPNRSNFAENILNENNFDSNNTPDFDLVDLKEENLTIVKIEEENIVKRKKTKTSSNKKTATYCNICHTDLQTKAEFWQHNAEAHGIEDNGATFKCFGCHRKFKHRQARLRHEAHFCKSLKSGYKCNLCNKYLQSRGTYEKHVKKHKLGESDLLTDKPEFKCRCCSKTFVTKTLLDSHKLKEHFVKRDYICEHCGRNFERHDYLRKHRMIHDNIKNYSCAECGFVTRQKSILTVHIRKHTGERPYSCDMCDLKFMTTSNLARHQKIHLGLKDFECIICLKKFGYKASLEDHMVSIHGEGEPTQKYSCDVCPAMFPRQHGLKRHLKNVHKIFEKKESVKRDSV